MGWALIQCPGDIFVVQAFTATLCLLGNLSHRAYTPGPGASNQLEQIPKHAHGSHSRACASTLHNQRACTVPLRMKHDDIIRAPKGRRERMASRISNKGNASSKRPQKNNRKKNPLLKPSAHLSLVDINDAHKPKHMTFFTSVCTHLCELLVELR